MSFVIAVGFGQVMVEIGNVLNYTLDILISITSVISLILYSYYLFFAFFGFIKKKTQNADDFESTTKFAVVVAAHNEEAVIAETIQFLTDTDYPKNLLDIYVVADNCSDDTAKLARMGGAIVHERTNTEKRGKGFALEWMFERIWNTGINYDAVCVLDADNIVDKNYFKEMNKSFKQGNEVIQGYLDCKNPYDSYIAGCYSIIFWSNNRVIQLARQQMGLSCGISGTGFVLSSRILKELGWGAYCLTEDLEFQLKCVTNNVRVAWNHDAIVYDEKPLKLKQSLVQRTRWMQGHSDCASRYFVPLIKKGFKEKKFIPIDTCMYLLQAYVFALMSSVVLLSALRSVLFGQWSNFIVILEGMGVFILYTAFILLLEHKLKKKILLYVLILPLYIYSWLPPVIKGWKNRHKTEWAHTVHQASAENINGKVKTNEKANSNANANG